VYTTRTRQYRLNIVDNPSAPGAVQSIGGFGSAEVARVMSELNSEPARAYEGGSRKEAVAEALTRLGAPQLCWGSITRWVWLDNERRKRHGAAVRGDVELARRILRQMAGSRLDASQLHRLLNIDSIDNTLKALELEQQVNCLVKKQPHFLTKRRSRGAA